MLTWSAVFFSLPSRKWQLLPSMDSLLPMARVSTETTWNDHFLLVCANLLQWRYNTIKFNQIYSCDIRGCSIPIVISAVLQTIMVMMTMTMMTVRIMTQFFVKHHWGMFFGDHPLEVMTKNQFFSLNHRHRLIVLNNNPLSVMVRWAMIYLLAIFLWLIVNHRPSKQHHPTGPNLWMAGRAGAVVCARRRARSRARAGRSYDREPCPRGKWGEKMLPSGYDWHSHGIDGP